jgi:hypothetical protein
MADKSKIRPDCFIIPLPLCEELFAVQVKTVSVVGVAEGKNDFIHQIL